MKPAQQKVKIIPKHYQKKLAPSIKTKNIPLAFSKQNAIQDHKAEREAKIKECPLADEKLQPPQPKRFQNNSTTYLNYRY